LIYQERKKKKKSKDKFDFETAIDHLEKLVNTMEAGNLKLEDSLKYFEQGIGLIRQCQSALQSAEQKVQKLVEKNGQISLSDYSEAEEN